MIEERTVEMTINSAVTNLSGQCEGIRDARIAKAACEGAIPSGFPSGGTAKSAVSLTDRRRGTILDN